ncbi:PhoH family protein [Dasania sp. GY-MA-18]|uniref:PhoH-like protein n=1 Tax=Dasania phycosphaerae TaxID=2950436 RepID=A0A9J6RG28_9GAMM|nr:MULTISPECIES: PhoH family protein [Dasania]MCR8921178.1 PhoH family protein [Dasania sp. GY-MA-18]MCZ0863606.1 PhoH family protein [Dasania phycosphaerae]MCZ0867334.1 PhoH family protein [Dasania phycosphaerae]
MNKNTSYTKALHLEPNDARYLANLCGQLNEHLRQIEQRLAVTIHNRGNHFTIAGQQADVDASAGLITQLYREARNGIELTPQSIHLNLQQAGIDELAQSSEDNPLTVNTPTEPATDNSVEPFTLIHTKKLTIKPRGKNQQGYVRSVLNHDINFGIGPAGTGKTYLAVACAVQALLNEEVQRILLVRPAVEAGEKLGFLPGDLAQKIDPYLRPLYDALYDMLGDEAVTKLIERNVIEIAPLAYMRGRTLNDSYIILDESQNTTKEQMKMFLTRIGFGSTAVITGDATQIDLPRGTQSGLTHVIKVLEGIEGISFTYFESKDVVRHPLVARIVDAYEAQENHEQSIKDQARGSQNS